METLSLLHQNLWSLRQGDVCVVIRSQKVPMSSSRTRCVIRYAGACSCSDSSAGAFMFARMLWVTYVKLASENLLTSAGSFMAHGSLWPFQQQSRRTHPESAPKRRHARPGGGRTNKTPDSHSVTSDVTSQAAPRPWITSVSLLIAGFLHHWNSRCWTHAAARSALSVVVRCNLSWVLG